MRINIVAVLFIVPAIFWATPRYGAIGAAWVWATLNAGYLLIGIHFMYRRILSQEKWEWYARDIVAPLLAGAAVAAGLHWALPSAEGSLAQLTTLALASALTLLAAGLAADRVRRQASAILQARWNGLPLRQVGRRT